MRWPLRNQVLLPMLGVMFATLLGVSVLNAILSLNRERWRIERELQSVADTLEQSNFPLTDAVLRQMRGLSGAEYVLHDRDANIVASTVRNLDLSALANLSNIPMQDEGELGNSLLLGNRRFHYARLRLHRSGIPNDASVLHILYPEESYRESWWRAVLPPLVVGGCASLLVVALGLAVTSRVTRPLHRLQAQTEEIALGSFRQLPISSRDDEIADLSRSVNRMVQMLARYETEVRRNEQMRTLGQLGGGIGHQMRNAVTGCRLAIELHARQCSPSTDQDESLGVARRQLELMEHYLNRFLALGRTDHQPHVPMDLAATIGNVLQLVKPAAAHVNVEVTWNAPSKLPLIPGDADAIEQLLVNLLLNAIEAAAQVPLAKADGTRERRGHQPADSRASGDATRCVMITAQLMDNHVRLEIADSGPGPADEVHDGLFEPFVTEKPDGTGLGLWVARQIVDAHDGDIHWDRRGEKTYFTVDLPMGDSRGEDGTSFDC